MMNDRDKWNSMERFWQNDHYSSEEFNPEIDENNPVYQELIADIEKNLNAVELPPPPASLVDDVMAYINERQKQESVSNPKPGISIFISVWNTIKRYSAGIEIPRVFQREPLAVSLAFVVIVWSVFISPQVQAGKMDPILTKANTMVDNLVIQGEEISNQITERLNSLAAGLIKKSTETEEIDSKTKETDEENRTIQTGSAFQPRMT